MGWGVVALVVVILAFGGCSTEGSPENATSRCGSGVREVVQRGGKAVAICDGGNAIVLP